VRPFFAGQSSGTSLKPHGAVSNLGMEGAPPGAEAQAAPPIKSATTAQNDDPQFVNRVRAIGTPRGFCFESLDLDAY
jgi:hypothetical protein